MIILKLFSVGLVWLLLLTVFEVIHRLANTKYEKSKTFRVKAGKVMAATYYINLSGNYTLRTYLFSSSGGLFG